MNLRLRLIVAFFLLSVVPLGAVTFYSYRSNAGALRDAAQHEAEGLAGELTQRMQMVTAQLTERVGHLMDMNEAQPATVLTRNEPVQQTPATRTTKPAVTTPKPSSSGAKPSSSAANANSRAATKPSSATPSTAESGDAASAASSTEINTKVAEALGEVAMLFNNIELRGMRGEDPFRRGGGPPGGRGGTGGAQGRGANASAGSASSSDGARAEAARQGQRYTFQTAGQGSGSSPGTYTDRTPGSTPPRAGGRAGSPETPNPANTLPPPPPPPGRVTQPTLPGLPPVATVAGLDERIRIDMAPIRREMLKSMLPDGEFEKLSPEERQRVVAEVNQRMMGIAQGIRLGATEIQKRVNEAQREAAEANRTAAESKTRVVTIGPAKPANPAALPAPPAPPDVAPPTPPVTTPRTPETLRTPEARRAPETTRTPAPEAPAKPAVPTPPPPAPAAPAPSATQRKMAITGSKFDVRLERDGKVVNQVNAEINLPALMQTVFGTTRRDRGEVPFAVGKDGQIYTQLADDKAKVEALGAPAKPESAPGTFVTKDWVTVTTADPTGSGLKFGIARPVGDSMSELRRTTARNAGFGLGFIGLALIGIVPLSARLTKNLSSLSEGVKRIAEGDYRARVPVQSQDEIGRLATAFNQMAADVEKHQRAAVEQERIKRELELGRQIQHDMQPHGALTLGLTEIKGVSVPARAVGGDFFNYFQLSSGQIAMLVGDVSGKGVGAALLMANIQAALRTRLSMLQDLASLARELDVDIEASTPGPVYATLFVGILDPATRVLRYVNAGHHPQFVLKKDHSLERMTSTGLPIGLYAGRGYTEDRVQLTAGDVLFFYTDGCVEAESESGDMFGAERLEKLLSSLSPDSADDLLVKVEAAVAEFRGAREPFDDATMMAVRVG